MRFADDLRRLPPEERFADKLDRGDRYFMLFVVAACSAGGASTSEVFYSLRYGKCAAFCLGQLCGVGLIDWDEPSRMINSAYDRLRIAMSKPTRAERRAAVDDLHRDLKRIVTEGDDWKTLVKDAVAARSLRIAIGRQMGRALLQVDLPPKVVRADDRYAAYRGMDELLCPLAAYRADHGEYPAELAQLSPKYLKTLPEDPFGKGPLRYKREPKGYVVYSVGYNGKDDGGHDYDLEYDSDLPPEKQPKISKDADDISLRVPPGPKD
jgi:hypothetical protein